MLEGIICTRTLCYKHIGLFSNNTAEVLWKQRGAAKNSAEAGRLLRVLALQKRVARASLLVAEYVEGELNVLGDIPSLSFVYSKTWNFTNDSRFLSLINYQLPLPHQSSWQGFLFSFTLSTKVISKLGTRASPMGEWK